jgi:periplasmic divalent cation tolerance protein
VSVDPGVRVVLTTFERTEDAVRIISMLVEEQLVACGNLIPGVRSIYRWQGAVEDAPEVLCVLKTAASRLPTLVDRLQQLHPYDVPEILVLPVDGGSTAYLDWVRTECRPDGKNSAQA